jgi:hypothetical protein
MKEDAMRVILLLYLALLFGLVLGCGSRQESGPPHTPLFVGKLEGGTFWKTSLQNSTSTNEGGGYDKGSRVEVYDQFIVVTTPDGLSHLHPHGFYSGLVIKKD